MLMIATGRSGRTNHERMHTEDNSSRGGRCARATHTTSQRIGHAARSPWVDGDGEARRHDLHPHGHPHRCCSRFARRRHLDLERLAGVPHRVPHLQSQPAKGCSQPKRQHERGRALPILEQHPAAASSPRSRRDEQQRGHRTHTAARKKGERERRREKARGTAPVAESPAAHGGHGQQRQPRSAAQRTGLGQRRSAGAQHSFRASSPQLILTGGAVAVAVALVRRRVDVRVLLHQRAAIARAAAVHPS